jgi:hypothetical protein
MSGELLGNGATHDSINLQQTTSPDMMDAGKITTDVEGVFADGTKDGAPIFSVSKEEFFNNMKSDRRRLRFKSDAPVSSYLRGSRYNQPFYVQYKGDDGHYLRRVKGK